MLLFFQKLLLKFMTINLLSLLKKYDCYNLIFSSSSTVFGQPKTIPVSEQSEVGLGIIIIMAILLLQYPLY
jgi:UDP-glucose 4-epimerase